MSKSILVTKLFKQEFNKDENYKAIMKRIHGEEKKQEKRLNIKRKK